MRFLFTKNGKIGSKLIRWGSGEDCSHFILGLDSPNKVLESRLGLGFTEDDYAGALARNTVVHCLEARVTPEQSQRLYASVYSHCAGKKYDENGLLWWAAVCLGRKLFGLPVPARNQWEDKGRFYCVEILKGSERLLHEMLGVPLALDMLTPGGLYRALLASPVVVESKYPPTE